MQRERGESQTKRKSTEEATGYLAGGEPPKGKDILVGNKDTALTTHHIFAFASSIDNNAMAVDGMTKPHQHYYKVILI